jgi:nitric oxide reductase subunit B
MIGDTVFAIGVVALGWFVPGLKTGWSLAAEPDAALPAEAVVVTERT